MAVITVEAGKKYVATGVSLTYDSRGLRNGMLATGTKMEGVGMAGGYGIVNIVGPGWSTLTKSKENRAIRVELDKISILNPDGSATSVVKDTIYDVADKNAAQNQRMRRMGRAAEAADVGGGGTTTTTTTKPGEAYYQVNRGQTIMTYDLPMKYGEKKPNGQIKGDNTPRSQVTVYTRWTDPSTGTTYGAIDASGSKWIQLSGRGNPNRALTQMSKTQANLGTGDQSKRPTAPQSKLATQNSGGNMPVVSDSGDVVDANDDTYATWDESYKVAQNLSNNTDYGNTSAAIEAVAKMQHCIGLPPLITEAADPRYMSGSKNKSGSPGNTFGRSYIEMFLMNNCTVNLKPIGVKYLPGIEKDKNSEFVTKIASWAGGAQDDDPFLQDPTSLQGQLWDTEDKYAEYIETVNVLARTIAIVMGIGGRPFPNGKGKPYSAMDYTYYNVQGQDSFFQDIANGWSANDGNGLFAQVGGAVAGGAAHLYQRGVTDVINDESFVHFYMSGDGFSSNDSIGVTTKSTSIEGLFNNGLSELASDLQFLFGSNDALNNIADSISSGLGDLLDATGLNTVQALNGIVRNGANYLKGARIVFPQQLDDCNYDRSLTCTCRFISPNGDPESQFLYCYLPLCYLWPYVLPQMLTDNMYKYPFLCKVDAPGIMHSDLAAMTNLRVQRGGTDGTNWGIDGRAFEVDVSFDITPLYSKLMVTSSKHPILFMTNTALHEYLGSMVGVNFTGDNFEQKLQIAMSLLKGGISDTLTSGQRGYIDSGVANIIRKVMQF